MKNKLLNQKLKATSPMKKENLPKINLLKEMQTMMLKVKVMLKINQLKKMYQKLMKRSEEKNTLS